MKTNNQTEQGLLELSAAKAANEESYGVERVSGVAPKQAWCPADVWRTRVKSRSLRTAAKPAQR